MTLRLFFSFKYEESTIYPHDPLPYGRYRDGAG